MPAKVLMIQGTASSAGKSLLVAALCRILRQDGWSVAPFKAQNMSLNAYPTVGGGEVGRAQVVQAWAAGIEPSVDMNPILLKPEGERRSQVVVQGRVAGTYGVADYYRYKPELWPVVTASLDRLRAAYEIVVIEGAGSPAEPNLRDGDIVNMRVARHLNAPVLLIGDIDRGGVFAALVGTLALLDPAECALVRALVINKFRGDLDILEPALADLKRRTGVPIAGVLPYLRDVRLPAEDSLDLVESDRAPAEPILDIAVVQLPRISNFDELDALRNALGVRLRYARRADELGVPDLTILPGSKSTIADLLWLRARGLDRAIHATVAAGGAVLGICGGYQMLGRTIHDPLHSEADITAIDGLGLLPVETTFAADKRTERVVAHITYGSGLLAGAEGLQALGYEIHMGRTTNIGNAATSPLTITPRDRSEVSIAEGSVSADGWVWGTSVHGLLENADLRRVVLTNLAARKDAKLPEFSDTWSLDQEFDRLAAHVRAWLDLRLIYQLIGVEEPSAWAD